MPILIDILIIAFIGFLVYISYKKGFIMSVMSLAGYVISSIAASIISKPISEMIFKNFLRQGLIDSIKTEINKLPTDDLSSTINNLYSKIPYIKNFINQTEFDQTLKDTTNSINDLPAQITDDIVAPVVIMVISSIVFIILFALLGVAFNYIIRMVNVVDKIPLVGTINHVLGGVLGFLKAVIIIYVVAVVFSVFVGLSDFEIQKEINNSIAFNVFYNYNPFVGLISDIGL